MRFWAFNVILYASSYRPCLSKACILIFKYRRCKAYIYEARRRTDFIINWPFFHPAARSGQRKEEKERKRSWNELDERDGRREDQTIPIMRDFHAFYTIQNQENIESDTPNTIFCPHEPYSNVL